MLPGLNAPNRLAPPMVAVFYDLLIQVKHLNIDGEEVSVAHPDRRCNVTVTSLWSLPWVSIEQQRARFDLGSIITYRRCNAAN